MGEREKERKLNSILSDPTGTFAEDEDGGRRVEVEGKLIAGPAGGGWREVVGVSVS